MKRLVTYGAPRAVTIKILTEPGDKPGQKTLLLGVIGLEVTSNAHYQADKWRASVAVNAGGGHDAAWWGDDARIGELFDLRVAMDGKEAQLILGEADSISLHPETGLVELEGRDLTGRFIDNRIQEAFQNKTASEIVTTLAQRRGLTPKVTATTTPVSRYYGDDHDRVQHNQFSHVSTEWDLMANLARFENFDLYVKGRELWFVPAVDASRAEPFGVFWDNETRRGDVSNLHNNRSLTLAKDVIVAVTSWRSANGKSFTRTSPAGSGLGKVQAGKAQRYPITRPNLTEDDAQKLADSTRAVITRNEKLLSFDCPGELYLTARDVIAHHGVGGSWDQRYYVDTVTRRVSYDGGFMQNVTAKNHNVESGAAGIS